MTETIPVFINAAPVQVPRGTDVRGAIAAVDPNLAERVVSGTASVTDARGLRLAPELVLTAGAILRVIVSARRSDRAEADE